MVNPEISRRNLLKLAGAGLGAFALKTALPGISPAQGIENGRTYTFSADFEAFPGYFFPTFARLEPLLFQFAEAHFNETGEDVWEDLMRARAIYDGRSSQGICNAFTDFYVSRRSILPENATLGGRRFGWDKIAGLASLLHYCDAREPQTNGSRTFGVEDRSMVYLHHFLFAHLRRGRGFGIDRSDSPNEMWSHPVDRATVTKTEIGRGWVEVRASMRAANYLDEGHRGADYRYLNIAYKVNELDINEGGIPLSANFELNQIWRPVSSDSDDCLIRGNVFRASAQRSIEKLLGER